MRDAMGCFATGITVVTTVNAAGEAVGLTVNSFNSVSLEPPLVLFSLARDASRLREFLTADRYAINVLRDDQRELSMNFAKPGENGFDSTTFAIGEFGAPIIPGVLAVFECETFARHEGGDHLIFIGRVLALHRADDGDPLLYYQGHYATTRSLS